jgi:5-methylcytosine-specific restriction endonuclease McrA
VTGLRLYDPAVDPFEDDGYPTAWRHIKHQVRAQAGHRCVRCGHPFIVGTSGVMEGPHAASKAFAAGLGFSQDALDLVLMDLDLETPLEQAMIERSRRINWSACDEHCTHDGPVRVQGEFGDWSGPLYGVDIAVELDGGFNVEAAWRILTTHHLDGNKANCRWWNLAALCQRCHLKIQRKVDMAQIWPTEHSDWFKVYAAGYYAHCYLGEDLDRDETEARMGELLELERVA